MQNIKLRQNVQPQNDDNSTNMNDYVYNLWKEDFCPVAQRLLRKYFFKISSIEFC